MDDGFQGDKLRLARQFYGMSLAELGAMIEASRQYIHQLESDAKIPSAELENALATALNVESRFFRVSLRNSVKVEQTHFRKLRSTPINLIHRILAHGTMCEQLILYLDAKLSLPPVNFPEFQVGSFNKIEKAAENCRAYWGLSYFKPISNITRVVENAGAVVVHFENMSADIDALSMSRARPIIVRSTKKESLCRLRFDLAHECGHLVMHQGIETGDKKTEQEAHRFASAFLMPADAFQREFPKKSRMDWRAIFSMKLKWKASAAAIVRRAYDLELIDNIQYRSANIQLRKNGQAKSEKFDDELPLEKPELLVKCFDVLKENRRLYMDGIASDLGIKPKFLRSIVGFILKDLNEELGQNENSSTGNVIRFDGSPLGDIRQRYN